MTEFTLLAGTNKVGVNSLLVEHGHKSVLVNVGSGFIDDHWRLVVPPDLNNIEGVFLTSGDDSDCGGISELVKNKPDLDIFVSEITKKVVEQKLRQVGLSAKLHTVSNKSHLQSNGIEVRFFESSQTIAGSLGLQLSTADGSICFVPHLQLPLISDQLNAIPKSDLLISPLYQDNRSEEILNIVQNFSHKRTLILVPDSATGILESLIEYAKDIDGRVIVLGGIVNTYRAMGKSLSNETIMNPKMMNRPSQHRLFIVASDTNAGRLPSSDIKLNAGDALIYSHEYSGSRVWQQKLNLFATQGIALFEYGNQGEVEDFKALVRQLVPSKVMFIGSKPNELANQVSKLPNQLQSHRLQIPTEGLTYSLEEGKVKATNRVGNYLRIGHEVTGQLDLAAISISVQLPRKEDPVSLRNVKIKYSGFLGDDVALITKLKTNLIVWLNDNRKLEIEKIEAELKHKTLSFWAKYQQHPPQVLVAVFLSSRA